MTFEMNERLIADFACLDPIYVDGAAGFLNLGDNFATRYYRWQLVGPDKFEKTPAVYLIQPRRALLCKAPSCLIGQSIGASPAPPTAELHQFRVLGAMN
jgi:hypothetical protein